MIVDTSDSIGHDFNNNVKPFLEKLIINPQLNVGPDGTHVGLILFSSKEQTRIDLKLGQIKDANQLAEYMGDLNYDYISGDRTRTELALQEAKSVRTYFDYIL